MLKKLLLAFLFVAMGLPSFVFAGRGGSAFGGALAGSMVGGLMSGAMTSRRDKVVVVDQSRGESQAVMEARIRRQIELEDKIKELEMRIKDKRVVERQAPKRPQFGQQSKREIKNRIKDLEKEIRITRRQLQETKK